MSWIKYFVVSLLFLIIILLVTFASATHQSNVTATQDADLNANVSRVGLAREMTEGRFDLHMLIEELTAEIGERFKGHKGNVKVQYEMYDENGKKTTNPQSVKSIQFETHLLNQEGKVQSISREKVEINTKK